MKEHRRFDEYAEYIHTYWAVAKSPVVLRRSTNETKEVTIFLKKRENL
jgi:hypothetical protein